MREHSPARLTVTLGQGQRACSASALAMRVATEYDLPGDWEQPDFEDDNEDETELDEEDEAGSRSWEHRRRR